MEKLTGKIQGQDLFHWIFFFSRFDQLGAYLKAGIDLRFRQLSLSPSVEEAPSEAAGRDLTA